VSPARRAGRSPGPARDATGEPFPLILCAPTGTGKTTLALELCRRRDDLVFSVSATTRPPRPGERDGVEYHFTSEAEFERMRREGELLEWARVHDWWYGTPAENLRAAQRDGRHLVLDIDVQGARQVRSAVPSAVAVFLLPPSFDLLLERLRRRGREDEAERRKRLETALAELGAADEFESVVVNEHLDRSVAALEAILDGDGPKATGRSEEVAALVAELTRAIRAYLAARV
jgi:guanylate kinase